MLTLTTPFWRPEPFTDHERALLDELFLAHHRSAYRDNPSSVTVANAAAGSGSLTNSIAAALLTLGAKHAPLEQTVEFLSLEDPALVVPKMLEAGHKIPGWGGSFQKNGPDPIWIPVYQLLITDWPLITDKLDSVTVTLTQHGKPVSPNPSAYTACVALALGIPEKLAPWLFIAGRLCAWTQIAAGHLK